MNDRRALLLRDPQRLEPACEHGERRHCNRRCAKPDIGAHPFGIPECVQRLDRGVAEEMKMHPAIDLWPVPFRMPRSDEMYLVPARGDAASDRLHEAADRIACKPRIGRRHHDNALAHRAAMWTYHNLKAASDRSSRSSLPGVNSVAATATRYSPMRSGFQPSKRSSRWVPLSETCKTCREALDGSTGSARSVRSYDRGSGRRILSVAPGVDANRIVTFPSTTRSDQPSTKN